MDVLALQVAMQTSERNSSLNASNFVMSTIWAWECPSHRTDMVCIFPNSTSPKEAGSNRMASAIVVADQELIASPPLGGDTLSAL